MVKTTHIGSLPFKNIDLAIEFNKLFSLPVLSTLPLISKSEYMLNQVLPGIEGGSLKNLKINLDKDYNFIDYKIPFIIEHDFFKEFAGFEIKWQIVGLVTLLKSFNNLSESEYSKMTHWHAKNIIEYHNFLLPHFSKVNLFLDEPMYNEFADKNLLKNFLDLLKNEAIEINIHCCANITHELFSELKLDGLSFDYTQLKSTSYSDLEKFAKKLYLGVINTQTFQRVRPIPFKDSYFLTPACGLAYSDPEMVLKVPNILKSQSI